MPLRHPIEILVAERTNPLDPWHAAIAESVTVIVGAEERPLVHDPQRGLYASDSFDEPTAVRVMHRGMVQERLVEPRRPPIRETFFFGGPDDEPVNLGGSYHPIPRMQSAVGVLLDGKLSPDRARTRIQNVLRTLPQGPEGVPLNRASLVWLRNQRARLAPVVFETPPTPEVLSALRRLPAIVGPVIHAEGNQILILTHHLVVRFHPGAVPALEALIMDMGEAFSDLKSWRWLPGRHPRIRWTTRSTLGFEVVGLGHALQAWDARIANVEVELAASGTHDAPDDPAWPFQVSLHRMQVAPAWDQVGRGTGRLLAVLDGANEFRHLSLGIQEFGERITTTFMDPTQPAASLDEGADDHGILCLGVAIAASNLAGIVGVAPEAQALAGATNVLSSVKTSQHRESLLRAAGLHPHSVAAAEIISVSHGFDEPNPILGALDREVLEQVVLEGRQGRGCPIFLSAGNNGGTPLDYLRGYRASPLTLTCGATTDIEGWETWATTSAPGPIDFCAPAFDAGGVPSVAVDRPAFTLELEAEQTAGVLRWRGEALAAGELVQLTRGGVTVVVRVAGSEYDLVSDAHVSTFEGSFDPTGCTAQVLPNTLPFGFTSAATPLCAAVGLLVLAADPLLSSIELREILRETADRADLRQLGQVALPVWIGHPQPLMPHDRLGYGRLNATAAVAAALARRGSAATPRDWPQLTIQSAWFTVGTLTEAWRVRRKRSMVLRVVIANVGLRASLEAWVRATIVPVDPLDALQTPQEIGQLAFHSIPPGKTRELRMPWPSDHQPSWEHFQLRVQVLPHHGPSPYAEVLYDSDVIEAGPPVRTWIITPTHSIYPALPNDPAPV